MATLRSSVSPISPRPIRLGWYPPPCEVEDSIQDEIPSQPPANSPRASVHALTDDFPGQHAPSNYAPSQYARSNHAPSQPSWRTWIPPPMFISGAQSEAEVVEAFPPALLGTQESVRRSRSTPLIHSTPPDLPARPIPWSGAPGTRSKVYYFEDGNVIFQVEDVLYRVHKYFFERESSVFRQMFSHPQESPGLLGPISPDCREGNNDSQPIPLIGVSCPEFEALLEFMYFAVFTEKPFNLHQWISILHLSNMWRFDGIQRQAVRHIDALDGPEPVDKIILAKKEGIEKWLLPAYVSLVERRDPISVQEARKLMSLGDEDIGRVRGLDIVPKLAQARERYYRNPSTSASTIVDDLFGWPVFSRSTTASGSDEFHPIN